VSRLIRAIALLALVVSVSAADAATPTALNDAGTAAYGRGDFEGAVRLFDEAVAAAPREPLYRYHRGVALFRLGRFSEARASYDQALTLKPAPPLDGAIRTALRQLAPLSAGPRSQAGDVDTVALQHTNGLWLVEVLVNGTRRGTFMVDPKATSCVISPDVARELGIDVSAAPQADVMTAKGKATGPRVSLESLKVGETEATTIEAIVLPRDEWPDGVLGNSFLSRYAATLDAERSVLHLRSRR
jgi:clan AA aspartic protease (TIGR02281 family)